MSFSQNILLQSFLAFLSFKYFIFLSANESAPFDWALFLNSNLEPDKILTSALHSFREINLESFGSTAKGIDQVSADGSARRKNFWKFLNFLKSGQRRARERNHGISYLNHSLTVMTYLKLYDSSTWLIEMYFLGLCENLAPAGMDGRESTRIRTPVKTPKRFRSASSPFASPMSDAMLTGKFTGLIWYPLYYHVSFT